MFYPRIVLAIGIFSLLTKGLNQGVDFSGGRTYVVRFDREVNTVDLRKALAPQFGNEPPEVKTFGPDNQVKITTKYLIDDESTTSDSIVESHLYRGLKDKFETEISRREFLSDADDKVIGKLSFAESRAYHCCRLAAPGLYGLGDCPGHHLCLYRRTFP
ncbi:MAG: hypothetical protein U5L09_19605 [Bacteroidales bacterium]|nr:hypothetical protein [Bacteroidales bacterium]